MVGMQRFEGLVEDIEKQKNRREEEQRQIGEKASAFPTREEYLEKHTEERLTAAKEILAEYAVVSVYTRDTSTWAVAHIDPNDEQHPGITLTARVGYRAEDDITERVGEGRRAHSRTVRTIPESIPVQVYARDAKSGLTSETQGLGQFREGTYVDEEGERQDGWHVFRRSKGRYEEDKGSTLTLQSKLGQDMLEFVDAAVLGLIDGVVSEQRKFIGGQAVEGAVEQPSQ
jgi:hypothetical protein